jgi:glycosyltransferase involved in cell wall biosynthesis
VSDSLRVALYSGLFVRHDAISNSVRHKLDILTDLELLGLPVETTVLTHVADYADPRVRVVRDSFDAMDIVAKADVHIFEFGIWYDLFDSVFMLRPGVVSLGIYHNITPPSLMAEQVSRDTIERSFLQKHNLCRLDHVACVSEFNRDDLVEFGVAPERLSVLHLPAAVFDHRGPADPTRRPADCPVRLLFLGRFVRSKGVLDLLEAVTALIGGGLRGFHLTIAGNSTLSDSQVVESVHRVAREERFGQVVSIAEDPSDEELRALYEQSDALIMPSYHEGYGVPIVEAMSAGCYVLAYASGNVPNVMGGLGSLVPTGDVRALAATIGDHVERVRRARVRGEPLTLTPSRGPMNEAEWRAAVTAHLVHYSHAGYRRSFLDVLRRTTCGLPGGTPVWLAQLEPELEMSSRHDHSIRRHQHL